jgi:hypothetical protein
MLVTPSLSHRQTSGSGPTFLGFVNLVPDYTSFPPANTPWVLGQRGSWSLCGKQWGLWISIGIQRNAQFFAGSVEAMQSVGYSRSRRSIEVMQRYTHTIQEISIKAERLNL